MGLLCEQLKFYQAIHTSLMEEVQQSQDENIYKDCCKHNLDIVTLKEPPLLYSDPGTDCLSIMPLPDHPLLSLDKDKKLSNYCKFYSKFDYA